MTAQLHRYWFKFVRQDYPTWINLGCAVTAGNEDDARELMRNGPFYDRAIPEIAAVIVDVDVRTLDPGHVLPNMEPPHQRGIWFPQGFSSP